MEIGSCIVMFFTLFLVLISAFAEGPSKETNKNSTTSVQPAGTLKTIHTDYGEVIDCVDIYKQPAFDHPLLKNHQIRKPSSCPAGPNKLNLGIGMPRQSWRNFGECPTGSIPILRSIGNNNANLQTQVEVEDHQVHGDPIWHVADAEVIANHTGIRQVHGTYLIWKPRVERDGDQSFAMLMVASANGSETIQAGWRVRQSNGPPRFFVAWTNHEEVVCFNLDCPGFIHTNPRVVLDGQLPIETDKIQEVLHLHFLLSGRKWRLYLGRNEVGYWPLNLFRDTLTRAFWSGRVVRNSSGQGVLEMGNGRLPSSLKSARIVNAWAETTSISGRKVQFLKSTNVRWNITDPNCYDSRLYGISFIDYGGPGCRTTATRTILIDHNVSQLNSFSPLGLALS